MSRQGTTARLALCSPSQIEPDTKQANTIESLLSGRDLPMEKAQSFCRHRSRHQLWSRLQDNCFASPTAAQWQLFPDRPSHPTANPETMLMRRSRPYISGNAVSQSPARMSTNQQINGFSSQLSVKAESMQVIDDEELATCRARLWRQNAPAMVVRSGTIMFAIVPQHSSA